MGSHHLPSPYVAPPHAHRARSRHRPRLPTDDAHGEEEEKERFYTGITLQTGKLGLMLEISWE